MLVDCRGLESALEAVRVSVEAASFIEVCKNFVQDICSERVKHFGFVSILSFDIGTFVLLFLSVSGSGSTLPDPDPLVRGMDPDPDPKYETVAEK